MIVTGGSSVGSLSGTGGSPSASASASTGCSACGSWSTAATDYTLIQQIGQGSFSTVWQARAVLKGAGSQGKCQDVAIKIMDLEHICSSFEDVLQEVQTMRLCDDPNVLRCYCSFVRGDQLWLVTQYMDKGSCLRVMTVAQSLGLGLGFSEDCIAHILRESLQGLRYLHSNGRIHRDVKCGNILVDSAGNVRLADFGVSGWTVNRGERHETVRTFVGTPCWMAPEVMEQVDGYDHRADIWSLGITALELAKGQAPYARFAPMRVLVLTIEEEPPSLACYDNDRQPLGGPPFSKAFEEFYKKCLQKNPKLRPSAEDLLKLKLFKHASREALVTKYLDKIPSVSGANPCSMVLGEDRVEQQEAAGGRIRQRLPSDAWDVSCDGDEGISEEASGAALAAAVVEAASHQVPVVLPGPAGVASAVQSLSPAPEQQHLQAREYAAGTTWVFDDGSGVARRGAGTSMSSVIAAATARRSGSNSGSRGNNARDTSQGASNVDEFLTDFEAEVQAGEVLAGRRKSASEDLVAPGLPAPHDEGGPMGGGLGGGDEGDDDGPLPPPVAMRRQQTGGDGMDHSEDGLSSLAVSLPSVRFAQTAAEGELEDEDAAAFLAEMEMLGGEEEA